MGRFGAFCLVGAKDRSWPVREIGEQQLRGRSDGPLLGSRTERLDFSFDPMSLPAETIALVSRLPLCRVGRTLLSDRPVAR